MTWGERTSKRANRYRDYYGMSVTMKNIRTLCTKYTNILFFFFASSFYSAVVPVTGSSMVTPHYAHENDQIQLAESVWNFWNRLSNVICYVSYNIRFFSFQ